MIHLMIPDVLPTLNKLMNQHYRVRMRQKRTLYYYLRESYGEPLPFERRKIPRVVRVKIHVYQRARRYDEDNLHGATKMLVDVLRESGFIYRDSPDWLKKTLTQSIDRANPRVEIKIEEVL